MARAKSGAKSRAVTGLSSLELVGLKQPLGLARLGVNIDHIATLRQLRGTPRVPPLLQHV